MESQVPHHNTNEAEQVRVPVPDATWAGIPGGVFTAEATPFSNLRLKNIPLDIPAGNNIHCYMDYI